jgi:protein phosphatase PTC7
MNFSRKKRNSPSLIPAVIFGRKQMLPFVRCCPQATATARTAFRSYRTAGLSSVNLSSSSTSCSTLTIAQHLPHRSTHSLHATCGRLDYHTFRKFSSSSRQSSSTVQAVTGYAFAGKPRTVEAEEEKQREYVTGEPSKTTGPSEAPPRQGFPPHSIIGSWVDSTLKGGESGEDALLFERMKGEGDVIFGVADGVGGWSENGIDPALFSQSLMYHSAQYARDFYACPERLEAEDMEYKHPSPSSSSSSSSTSSPKASTASSSPPSSPSQSSNSHQNREVGTPLDVLEYAFQKTQEQTEVPAGSATACIVSFDSSKGIIRTANLGDSGFLVLRPSAKKGEEGDSSGLPIVYYQSRPQTHGFNTPLQLSKLPPEYRFEGSIDSKPSHADLWSCQVLDGDMVLVATDGFWDNVSVNEVLPLVKYIEEKHRVAHVDRMLDISSSPLAEEEDLANVLAHK